jgi:hypothetical protein
MISTSKLHSGGMRIALHHQGEEATEPVITIKVRHLLIEHGVLMERKLSLQNSELNLGS